MIAKITSVDLYNFTGRVKTVGQEPKEETSESDDDDDDEVLRTKPKGKQKQLQEKKKQKNKVKEIIKENSKHYTMFSPEFKEIG